MQTLDAKRRAKAQIYYEKKKQLAVRKNAQLI